MPPAIKDTVLAANPDYKAGGFQSRMMGDEYRDLWTTPIRVPILDLQKFAGGLRPTKRGGGAESHNLRFMAADSSEWVFRTIHKTLLELPEEFDRTIIRSLILDARSASFPTAPRVAPPFLAAIDVLHPTPLVVVLPNDPILGEFREEFGGAIGTIEEFPSAPHPAAPFAGAVEIIDTEHYLQQINKDPSYQLNARMMLTVRLVDFLLNDNDRHPGQWKWARFRQGGEWIPISRDRDKVFISYDGLLLKTAKIAIPSLVSFDSTYPPGSALFENAVEFDRRLLGSLDKAVWDSVAASVMQRVTDSVIDQAIRSLPPEYAASFPGLSGKLKFRRDHLREAADEYYLHLFRVADIHATDADDRATVTRTPDGYVEVRIQSGNNPPWFARRFNPGETREIRLYLHGGDDTAVVSGSAGSSIPVRIIGGNGNNTMVDSSTVGGKRNPTKLYEVGSVSGVVYGPDTTKKEADKTAKTETSEKVEKPKDDEKKGEGQKEEQKKEVDESQLEFNRRPWIRPYGHLVPPKRDYGTSMRPVVGIKTGHGLGLVPKIGIARYNYAFRKYPYASMQKATVAYSTAIRGFDVGLESDNRFESSNIHIPAAARMTQLEVIEFRGFGNDVPNQTTDFYDVRQRQWSFRPAIGYSFGPESEISLGPIVRYTTTDSTANRFIAQERPYGFASFGQVGAQLKLYHDTRIREDTGVARAGITLLPPANPLLWGTLDFTGSVYPGMWDATETYEKISGVAAAYLTIPALTRPVIALRAGGEKLIGDFPYFDAAFIGGSGSLRTEHRQRYAGDASLFGTTELRVPLVKFPLILPWDVGALGFADAARVYVDGESPGGWHIGSGAGFWIGIVSPETSLSVLYTNNPDRRILTTLGFTF
jgi:hypothetical protein